MTSDPVACTSEQCQLGEGTRWDDRRGELLRVDILAGRVYRDEADADGALVPVRYMMIKDGCLPPTAGSHTCRPTANSVHWSRWRRKEPG
jgi:sugar lactone lactonase YvrE